MNMIKAFESRVAEAFEASLRGRTAPISFKKLARRTAREMEHETYVVNGVNTAPALITVLVSAEDDIVMRGVYPELTQEVSSFVEAEAARKGYVFVGKPLARFMVDPSLRHGRFAVFANNVDAPTLEKLRREEEAFLSGSGVLGGAANPDLKPIPAPRDRVPQPQQPLPQPQPKPQIPMVAPIPQVPPVPGPEDDLPLPIDASSLPIDASSLPVVEHAVSDDPSAGLKVLPANFVDESLREASATPEAVGPAASPSPLVTPAVGSADMKVPAVPAAEDTPTDNGQDDATVASPVQEEEPEPVTCLLIDRQSGRTYLGTAPLTIIGRERAAGNIVLHDPNVSRRHAELTYDGASWRIVDLGSTNGTIVNDIDVESCVLRNGDIVTLGLLNLEFRES